MDKFLQPQSVVLIGVSRQSGVGALNNLEMMLRFGYRGAVFVVHPKVPEILGYKTYASVADLPEVPDCAVISVGRDRVLPVFRDLAERGVRHVVVISQGFADADQHGTQLQQDLVAIARDYGVRVLGPNTMGIFNAFSRFSTAFIDLPRPPSPPPVAVVAQTGVLQVGVESFTGDIGKAIDIGNGCDLDFVDVLEYLERDSQTRIIVLHMEGMQRGGAFLEVAARVARTKPIVVFKTGRSRAGARAALSHTGSLVGEDAVFEAAFRRAGIVRVRSMLELKAAVNGLLHWPNLAGPNLGVITATGACGIMSADACEDYGLQLAPFPDGARGVLENQRIAWHHLNNPVDIWPLGMVTGSFTAVLERTAIELLQSDAVHSLLFIAPTMASDLHANLELRPTLEAIAAHNPEHKPLALWPYGDGIEAQRTALEGVPDLALFASIDQAVMALAARWRRQLLLDRLETTAAAPPASRPEAQPAAAPKAPAKPGPLLGPAASRLLAAYGIPLVPEQLTTTADQAAAFAERHVYPVVLKVIAADWLHKSDQGGVVLNLGDRAQLTAAYAELSARFRRQVPTGTLDGILVQRQLAGRELLFGVSRDPQFGALVVAGLGGIYTEVFRDVARALAPVSQSEAMELLRSLKSFPLLEGVRGEAGVDLPSLAATLVKLSRLAVDHPEIEQLDLNPVIATAAGCWAVDSRIIVGSQN